MSFGAFAGGLASGFIQGKELRMRQEEAERDKDRHAHDQERRSREKKQWATDDQIQAEKADFMKGLFADKVTNRTETMTGPTDAMDARSGAFSGGTQTPYNVQEQQGYNPFDASEVPKLFQMYSGLYAIDAKHGRIDPEKLKGVADFRKKLDDMDATKAARAFLATGDVTALHPLADKLGFSTEGLSMGVEPRNGTPVPVLTGMTKDGKPFKQDMMIFAAALGEDGVVTAMSKARDDDRADRNQQSLDEYRDGVVAAKGASGSAANGPTYESVRAIAKDYGFNYSAASGKVGRDGKAVRDEWANRALLDLALKGASDGMSEIEAVRTARKLVEKVNRIADEQGDWRKSKTDYDKFREMALARIMRLGEEGHASESARDAALQKQNPGQPAPVAKAPTSAIPMGESGPGIGGFVSNMITEAGAHQGALAKETVDSILKR